MAKATRLPKNGPSFTIEQDETGRRILDASGHVVSDILSIGITHSADKTKTITLRFAANAKSLRIA